MKERIIKYTTLTAVAVAIALCTSLIQDLYGMTAVADIMRGLCNCFSVPGMIFILVGLIVVCSNGGAYDIMGFAARKFFSVFRSAEHRSKETYREYRERKNGEKRAFWGFFIVGGIFFAVGMTFLIAYYCV